MEIDNFLPGSASLVEMVDKKLLISLRDGRHFYGILRTYDQFGKSLRGLIVLALLWLLTAAWVHHLTHWNGNKINYK